jgi:tetratricopeptide (TPR) repeat protein
MNEQRIKQLEAFILEEPDEPFNYYALAMEYETVIPDRALSILENLVISHPAYLPSYYKLGHFYWEDDELQKALEVFEAGILLAENYNDAKTLSELKSAYQNLILEM